MRRKPGTLVPLEAAILTVAVSRAGSDQPDLYAFELAKLIAEHERAGKLVAHGTLYKALNRLAESGMLRSDWEDPAVALSHGRPRRRLYRITTRGRHAVASAAISAATSSVPVGRLRPEPA